MPYNHGIAVREEATAITAPIEGTAGLQVIVGTAPIYQLSDPSAVVNKPIIAYSYAEAVEQLGYSDDWESFTLCQSIYACFKVFNVSPIILINVLDPSDADHIAAFSMASADVASHKVKFTSKYVLAGSLTVKDAEEHTLTEGTDYDVTYDDEGYGTLTLISTSTYYNATTLTIGGSKLNPAGVTASDVIGGYNASTGAYTGLGCVDQIYPKFNMTPGLLLAPGYSHDATVAAALVAATENINGSFKAMAIVDLNSAAYKTYSSISDAKTAIGVTSPNAVLVWPKVVVGSLTFFMSAMMGALIAYTDANNDDVPYMSPSNKDFRITGLVDGAGAEVTIDQQQANMVNSFGVVTAINVKGWKSWGNNTAVYPSSTDPKDRWIACRRFFSWWGNSFILAYFQKVDNPANFRLIQSIVDSENIRGNSYVAQGKVAAAYITFNEDENPITDILNGEIKFHMYLAPYVPAEYIENTLEFDTNALETALNGGE
jgi:phage tail sheath protein FI